MSLEFAIVPIDKTFLNTAYDLQTKLKNVAKVKLYIIVDTDFELQFNRRIQKWKKQEFHIVSIDEDYNESNCIIVRFLDKGKGSRPKAMEVEEFIELISSFEDENDEINNLDKNNLNNETNNTLEEDKSNGGCVLM